MTVAGVITGVLGLATSVTLLTVIGAVAAVGGLVTAGTVWDEYDLYVYWLKHVIVRSGTTKHSFAEKHIYYDGYGTDTIPVPDTLPLDILETRVAYNPSSDLFESDSAQFNAAYKSYSGT